MEAEHGDRPLRILDLFSGSGCVGIALLKHLPRVTVDFAEKDLKLCGQIRKNILLNNNIDTTRTRIIQTDVFSNITDSYDYIFANPPYISLTKKDAVQDSVLFHEPPEALFADDSGLFFIKKLLREAHTHLNPGGALYVEFGEGQKGAVAATKNTRLTEKEENPPVYLFTHRGGNVITGMWQTSAKEWLPLSFTPRNFGEEFMKCLTGYFKGKVSQ